MHFVDEHRLSVQLGPRHCHDFYCRRGCGSRTSFTHAGPQLHELSSERRHRHIVHAGCCLPRAIMQRFLQVSCQLCKLAVNREVTSQYPSMLQQAPSLTLGRYFSTSSLRGWDRQSVPCKMQSPVPLDIHQSTFAVQVHECFLQSEPHCSAACFCALKEEALLMQAMQTRGMKRLTPKFKGGKLKPYS